MSACDNRNRDVNLNNDKSRWYTHLPTGQIIEMREGYEVSDEYYFKDELGFTIKIKKWIVDNSKDWIKIEKNPIPVNAYNLEVFAIKTDDVSGKKFAYIGYKIPPAGDFHYVQVPFNEYPNDESEIHFVSFGDRQYMATKKPYIRNIY